MKNTNSRYVAADILSRWMAEKEFPDRHLARVKNDHAFVTEVVNGVVRHWRSLEWVAQGMIDKQPPPFIESLVFVGLYQLLYMDNVEEYAAIHETVEAAKKHRGGERFVGMLNAVLRRAQREKEDILKALERQPVGIRLSQHDFVLKRWDRQFGEVDTRKLCEWNNLPPETILRVQKSRISPDDLCVKMEEADIELIPHPYVCRESFFIVPRGHAVHGLPGYNEGWFTIQDPATSACVDLLRPMAGERILDACAAPGGKTAMIADRMRGEGELVAMDLHDDRIDVLKENMNRLGLDFVQTVQGDAQHPRAAEKLEPFDAILLDVPCMNTGVLRRRVDARWRIRMERMKKINQTQYAILTACSKLLTKGGRMVYSTCSLEPEENETLVNRWVRENPEFRLEKAKKLFPPKSGTDGAYAALIRKK